ncbi:MAG TPA: nucleoside recognition domain-containing protein [Syntrophomonadaceae bacterium]|mgnify:CR=1 FL=1|nr:nucleoside recognition domain-containing protein [Syntrophomonadaceae bacterium]HQA06858.1 nucleoside recognition domain-containing protein [Syntrophomonadaceae bacterium]HQE22840.1 nucleoside recognition domain-containing protein [Syntrophomonadaceae bacterium]
MGWNTILRGTKNGLLITWELARVVIPVFFCVTILKYTPVLPWISQHMVPIMKLLGLPGEAALPLVLGYFLNIYAAIGAMLPLGPSVREITIISVMLLLAHSLPMEAAVAKQTGVPVAGLILLRITLSFISGYLFNLVLP